MAENIRHWIQNQLARNSARLTTLGGYQVHGTDATTPYLWHHRVYLNPLVNLWNFLPFSHSCFFQDNCLFNHSNCPRSSSLGIASDSTRYSQHPVLLSAFIVRCNFYQPTNHGGPYKCNDPIRRRTGPRCISVSAGPSRKRTTRDSVFLSKKKKTAEDSHKRMGSSYFFTQRGSGLAT